MSTQHQPRCPKWSKELKSGFRDHIINNRINPQRSDKQYVESIRARYYPNRPYNTFRKNYNASIAEWRAGESIRAAAEARAGECHFPLLFVGCYVSLTQLCSCCRFHRPSDCP